VLDNGRIIFSSWHQAESGATDDGFFAQLAVNIDGTDLMAYSELQAGWHKRMSAPGNDGRVYMIRARSPGWLDGGDLAFVSTRRPLHSETVLARAEADSYHSPCPTRDGKLLVSYRPHGDAAYAVYRIDPSRGRLGELVFEKSGYHCLDSQELVPHPQVKGRSSVVNMEKQTGVFFCLSSHISADPGLQQMARSGRFQTLRVIEGRAGDEPQVMGEVKVEDDGSFHIEVPAQVPLRFEMLDGDGQVVAHQQTWTWVMPREWRGCIGCHEDREMVAPNVLAKAVVKPAVRLPRPVTEPQSGRTP
jgi:hypothetical protein